MRLRCAHRGANFRPNAVQGDDPQCENRCASFHSPLHACTLESLGEDRFAGRLGHFATYRNANLMAFCTLLKPLCVIVVLVLRIVIPPGAEDLKEVAVLVGPDADFGTRLVDRIGGILDIGQVQEFFVAG